MAKIDQNGLASVANAAGFTADQQAEITGQNSPSNMSFSGILGKLLAAATAAIQVVIDTAGRVVHCDSSASNGALPLAADSGAIDRIKLKPVEGQTGRSLEWFMDEINQENTPLHLAVKGVVDPTRPVMTVESLVTKLIAASPDGVKPIVAVNQVDGTVTIAVPGNNATKTTALNAATLVGDFKARVTLTEPAAEPGVTPLKFEGGAF